MTDGCKLRLVALTLPTQLSSQTETDYAAPSQEQKNQYPPSASAHLHVWQNPNMYEAKISLNRGVMG